MGIAEGASRVYLPDTGKPYPTLLEFFIARFPKIPGEIWISRIGAGKVRTEEGLAVSLTTGYMPDQRLFYFREVTEEPVVPFAERILFHNDHLLVACKPHFLPVSPTGPYVRETLLARLQARTGNLLLSPINRIDRETAGLVLLSTNKQTRGVYQQMFMTPGKVRKTYEAVSQCTSLPDSNTTEWLVENRIETGEPWFRMKSSTGPINARSTVQLIEASGGLARFQLFPVTGKKHQLRLHLSDLGFPIVHDRLYPCLTPESPDDFARPLQLLSQRIEFRDPLSGDKMVFTSPRHLALLPPSQESQLHTFDFS